MVRPPYLNVHGLANSGISVWAMGTAHLPRTEPPSLAPRHPLLQGSHSAVRDVPLLLAHPRFRMAQITRRECLELGAAAGVASVAGAACRTAGVPGALPGLPGPAIPPFALQEATLTDLERGLESGKYTAHALCENYLGRIEDLDRRGPTLRSIIEINPDALRSADELDASIVCPSAACSLVGIKPTLGLVSRSGIVPIAHSQDTAGPMARTVRDAAILLGALAGPDPKDAATSAAPTPVPDYTGSLDAKGLTGARLGIARS